MNSGPQLALGAQGQDVQRIQTIFVMMKTLGFDQIDGVFGIDDHTETSARQGVSPKDGAPGFRFDRDGPIKGHGCGYARISRHWNST